MTLNDAVITLMDNYLGPGNWKISGKVPSLGLDPAYDVTPLYADMDQILGIVIPSLQSQTSLPQNFKVRLETKDNRADITQGQIVMEWDRKKTIFPFSIKVTIQILTTSGILGTDEPTLTPI